MIVGILAPTLEVGVPLSPFVALTKPPNAQRPENIENIKKPEIFEGIQN